LRERLPDAVGVTDAQIAAAQDHLGVALPAELVTLYRITQGGGRDDDDHAEAVHCRLLPIDELTIADARSRRPAGSVWHYGADQAVRTRPDAPVQGVPGSPGWIGFGSDGGTARFAVDLTPGPAGHLGQIIVLDGSRILGAEVVADSLTHMVQHGRNWRMVRPDEYPAGRCILAKRAKCGVVIAGTAG